MHDSIGLCVLPEYRLMGCSDVMDFLGADWHCGPPLFVLNSANSVPPTPPYGQILGEVWEPFKTAEGAIRGLETGKEDCCAVFDLTCCGLLLLVVVLLIVLLRPSALSPFCCVPIQPLRLYDTPATQPSVFACEMGWYEAREEAAALCCGGAKHTTVGQKIVAENRSTRRAQKQHLWYCASARQNWNRCSYCHWFPRAEMRREDYMGIGIAQVASMF